MPNPQYEFAATSYDPSDATAGPKLMGELAALGEKGFFIAGVVHTGPKIVQMFLQRRVIELDFG